MRLPTELARRANQPLAPSLSLTLCFGELAVPHIPDPSSRPRGPRRHHDSHRPARPELPARSLADSLSYRLAP